MLYVSPRFQNNYISSVLDSSNRSKPTQLLSSS